MAHSLGEHLAREAQHDQRLRELSQQDHATNANGKPTPAPKPASPKSEVHPTVRAATGTKPDCCD